MLFRAGYAARSMKQPPLPRIVDRFRGFLPVAIDVETGGFDAARDALLEICAVVIHMDEAGRLYPGEPVSTHVEAFAGANISPRALEINGIDPTQPLRGALSERAALDHVFQPIRTAVKHYGCQRAVLVGHNAHFDLGFVNAAVARVGYKRNPFHPFSTFDTVTLAGVALGQTVLSRAVTAAGLEWRSDAAHSAIYDAERTATLFCLLVNRWQGARADSPSMTDRT